MPGVQSEGEWVPQPVRPQKKRSRAGRAQKSGICIDCGGPCVGKALRCLECRNAHRQERDLTIRSEEWRQFCRWAW
jgi:hypothetical protein